MDSAGGGGGDTHTTHNTCAPRYAILASTAMIFKMVSICFIFCHISACVLSWTTRFFAPGPEEWYAESWLEAEGLLDEEH